MLIDDTAYIMYGLSKDMSDCVDNSLNKLKTTPLIDVLKNIDQNKFIPEERNIIIFEIGRRFERGKNVGGQTIFRKEYNAKCFKPC